MSTSSGNARISKVHAELNRRLRRRRGELPVGLRSERQNALRVVSRRSPDLLDERRGDVDPAFEVEVAVGLGENGDAVAQPGIVVAEARAMIERPPGGVSRVGRIDARALASAAALGREVAVVVGAEAGLLEHRGLDRGQHPLALERDQPGVGIRIQDGRIGQVVRVIRAVGRVQIDEHVRIPPGHQLHQRSRFATLQLHVVAIEVETLRVLSRADTGHWAVLRGAVLDAHLLVAVGVVVGGDQHDQLPGQRLQIARHETAREHQDGFLALDFAGVNVGLHEDQRPVQLVRRFRRRHLRI